MKLLNCGIVLFVVACLGFAAFTYSNTSKADIDTDSPPILLKPAREEVVVKIPPPLTVKSEPLTIQKQTGETIPLNVELAVTARQHAQGLMFRTQMANNAGMLFIFRTVGPISFWMKNTLIPLDMLFLDENGKILHIHANAIPKDLTPVPSKYPAKAVLEINGGLAGALGIQEGDTVQHRHLSPVINKKTANPQ